MVFRYFRIKTESNTQIKYRNKGVRFFNTISNAGYYQIQKPGITVDIHYFLTGKDDYAEEVFYIF